MRFPAQAAGATYDTPAAGAAKETKLSAHKYGPFKKSRQILDYFARWAQGKIDNHLDRIVPDESDDNEEAVSNMETDTEVLSAAMASSLFEDEAQHKCPEKAVSLLGRTQFEVIHTTAPSDKGVRHMLLKGKGKALPKLYGPSRGDVELTQHF